MEDEFEMVCLIERGMRGGGGSREAGRASKAFVIGGGVIVDSAGVPAVTHALQSCGKRGVSSIVFIGCLRGRVELSYCIREGCFLRY